MVRTNQGGSILSFAILGGIMALLLVGGAYFIRQRLAPAERNPQVAITQEDKKPTEQASDKEVQEQKEEPTAPDRPAESNVPVRNGSSDSESATTPAVPSTGNQPADGLPSTGPSGGVLVAGGMLSALVAVIVAYLQSRRLGTTL